MNDKQYIIELLEKFLSGSLSSEEVLTAWPQTDGKMTRLVFNCWEAIYHYNTDSDIREKDPEYDIILRQQICSLLKELKMETEFQ